MTFRLIGEFKQTGGLSDIVFSNQDDRAVMVAGMGGDLRMLRVDTMTEEWSSNYSSVLEAVAFAPDGKRALVTGNRATTLIVNTQTGAPLLNLIGHANIIQAAAFSPDGQSVATGSSDATVMVWDAETGRDTHLFEEWAGSQVRSLVYSDDARYLAAGISEEIAVWDLTTYQKVRSIRLDDYWVSKMIFSPGMEYAGLIGEVEKDALVVDMETGRVRKFTGSPASLETMAFSPDRTKLLTGGWDGELRVWNALNGELLGHFATGKRIVHRIGLSHDGKRLLVSGLDRGVQVYEVSP